jgi:phospholipase/carboxylesterase
LLVLSAPILSPAALAAEATPAARKTPIFLAHGTEDPLIPFAIAESAHNELIRNGFRVERHDYCIPHSVSAEEVRDIARWLVSVLHLI